MLFRLQTGPIDCQELERAVAHDGAGAVLSFVGTVRDEHAGREVRKLDYQAWPEMAARVMDEIAQQMAARWPAVRLAVVHRTGSLGLGETSIVIAVSAPHRHEAYEASRFCIERIKARLPVWKREHYVDGEPVWVANAEFEGSTGPLGGERDPA